VKGNEGVRDGDCGGRERSDQGASRGGLDGASWVVYIDG